MIERSEVRKLIEDSDDWDRILISIYPDPNELESFWNWYIGGEDEQGTTKTNWGNC